MKVIFSYEKESTKGEIIFWVFTAKPSVSRKSSAANVDTCKNLAQVFTTASPMLTALGFEPATFKLRVWCLIHSATLSLHLMPASVIVCN